MEMLKFITAGSVDDGKSTLIGRLLYETDSILQDQLEAIELANRKNEDGELDLAILTDGLKAEREQGITIDVAYKYFQTEKRKFIIADTPGHVEYTRNMITGASSADLAIVLIDARKGVVEQTIRHAYLLSLLGVEKVLVCVNKMDRVGYQEEVFTAIQTEFKKVASRLQIDIPDFIPISALRGDNLVYPSIQMPWYTGLPLLEYLETVQVGAQGKAAKGRFPVQWVIRPQTDEYHDYRGYAGRVTSGSFRPGEPVVVLPSGVKTRLKSIELNGRALQEAEAGASVVFQLTDSVDVSRGDWIVPEAEVPESSKQAQAQLCWLDQQPLNLSAVYWLQLNSRLIKVKVQQLHSKLDIHSLQQVKSESFGLNDIGKVTLRFSEPLAFDPYRENKENGGAILIDPHSNLTVGAVMLE